MALTSNIFKKYMNNWFVESGSHVGEGIQNAIVAGFKNIISVEISELYFKYCVGRFNGNKDKVHLYWGDTEDLLEGLISPINEPITFWLDGHNSGGNTGCGKHESPLMQELEIIKNHPIKNHTIIIDDMRCWEKPHYDFDRDDIINFLKTINPNYEIIYENGTAANDIVIATIRNNENL